MSAPQEQPRPDVLIIDDSPFFRAMIADLLGARENLVVATAADGQEGWEMTLERRPLVVVTDWMMPNVDGIEFCRRVRETDELRSVYLILLTSKDRLEDALEALAEGADDFITKSADPREVVLRVDIGLRIARLYEALTEAERKITVLQMGAALSHEIFNPLQVVMGFAQVMAQDARIPPDRQKQAGDLLGAARRIHAIVRRLSELRDPHTKPYLGDVDMIDLDGV